MHPSVHSNSIITIAKIWKQCKHQSTDELTKKRKCKICTYIFTQWITIQA